MVVLQVFISAGVINAQNTPEKIACTGHACPACAENRWADIECMPAYNTHSEFPSRVVLTVEMHVPIARLVSGGRLLKTQSEPTSNDADQRLVHFEN